MCNLSNQENKIVTQRSGYDFERRKTFAVEVDALARSPDIQRSFLSGPSDWFRTSGLVVPNRNRKLFSDVSNGFLSFPLVFRYSRDLFGTLISACSARVCSNPCGQKRFPTKKTGSVFYVQGVCIVTLGRGLCKWFLRGSNSKIEPL